MNRRNFLKKSLLGLVAVVSGASVGKPMQAKALPQTGKEVSGRGIMARLEGNKMLTPEEITREAFKILHEKIGYINGVNK